MKNYCKYEDTNLLTERLEVGLNLDGIAADVVAKLLGLDVDLK